MSYGLKSISGFVWFSTILQILCDATFASHTQFDEKILTMRFTIFIDFMFSFFENYFFAVAIFDENNVNKQSILEKSLTTRQGCRKDIFDICTSSSSIMGRQEMSECLEKLSKIKKMLGYNANFLNSFSPKNR